ncbi:MAG: YunC family protein [Candidatus Odinarchaeia archaeon]
MEIVKVNGRELLGLRVDAFEPPLLMLIGARGVLSCGYFNIDAADKTGNVVAVVRGVNSFDDMLAAEVVAVSSKAEALGVKVGDKGSSVVERFA